MTGTFLHPFLSRYCLRISKRPDGWPLNIIRSLMMYDISQPAVETPAHLLGSLEMSRYASKTLESDLVAASVFGC